MQRWLVNPYQIPSEAMVATLNIGDRLFVLQTARGGVGEIVVFQPARGGGERPGVRCGPHATSSVPPADSPRRPT